MTTVDWVIIGIVTLSTVMSLWRGATREILSLITWIVAIYLGVKFASQLDGLFVNFIDGESVRFAAGFILIFLTVMIIGGLLNHLLSRFITFTGLTFLDRLLGIIFGLARGVLILAVCVVLANYTTVPQDDWWKKSQLLPHFEGISAKLAEWVQEQGFDPKKLGELIDSVDGKPKKANDPEKEKKVPAPAADVVPPASTGTTTNVLGASVKDEGTPNMLGETIVPAKTN